MKGLAEAVQRLSSENETLRTQSTAGPIRTVTTANEIVRLNIPTAFSGAEDEYSDWDFALTCFVGTMGTLLKEPQVVAQDQGSSEPRHTKWEKREHARSTISWALLTTQGPGKMVREVPEQNGYNAYRSLVLRCGSRDAHGETTLLIKEMNFNFGDIDVMESKFKEFNLLIKEHDDITGIHTVPDTTKRATLVAKAPEPLRTHLQLNSQSYSTFLEMRPSNQSVPESTQGFQTQKEREDDPVHEDFDHKESRKCKEKGTGQRQGGVQSQKQPIRKRQTQ